MALANKIVTFDWEGSPENIPLSIYSGDTYVLALVTTTSTGAAILPTDFPSISPAPAVSVSDSNGSVSFATAPTATFTTGSTTITFSSANTAHLEGRTGIRYDVSASGWTLATGTITLTEEA